MNTLEKLNQDIKVAMKAQDHEKKQVLRMLLSEIKYAQSSSNIHQELDEKSTLEVIGKYHKRLKKSLNDYPDGDKKNQILSEIAIVELYLPKPLNEEELKSLVDQVLNETEDRNFGVLMKTVLAKAGGNADGKIVSALLKAKLS